MRKETILAILAGILIGLIFAFGSWKVIREIKKNVPVTTSRPAPIQKHDQFITLNNLKDFDVITSNVVFSGLTNPNSNILVLTEEKDYLSKVEDSGTFEIQVELPAGLSQIKLIDFNDSDELSKTKINLVFSTEFKEKNGISYVGTITDISSETLQIKSLDGEIKQVSFEKDTKYINSLKKNIEVKSTDLAIGDYIVAMGVVNGNKVLRTKRILITSPIVENKYEAKFITIETLSKTKINDITLPKKWNGPNTKDLKVGQRIIITGLKNGDKFDIRSIFVIK